AVMNSATFDWCTRRKLNGIDLTQTIIRQVPVPPAERWRGKVTFQGVTASLADHVVHRVCSLLRDDARLEEFCASLCDTAAAPWDRRPARPREIDLLVAHAYELHEDDVGMLHATAWSDLRSDEIARLTSPSHQPVSA